MSSRPQSSGGERLFRRPSRPIRGNHDRLDHPAHAPSADHGASGGPHLAAAAKVIQVCGPGSPADRMLREFLRGESNLDSGQAGRIARGVFAYFRWQKWLEAAMPLERQVAKALLLEQRFAQDPGSFSDADLLKWAIPEWIHSELRVAPSWVRSLQQVPALWIRAKLGHAGEIAETLGNCFPLPHGTMPEALEYRGDSDLFKTDGFQAGDFELQDVSSQAVGFICAPKPGETWWDACAGEGGKTLHLSDLMENKGLIWASDRAEWRLRKLRERAARARMFNYRAAPWDGGAKLPTKTRFSGVLVDAPCSGVGTWGRNPDARWTLTPLDVKELAALQLELLRNASVAVKPGGRLVYSVCTLTRSETTSVAQAFERNHPEFRPVPFVNPLDGRAVPTGCLEIRPSETKGNGMFIAMWEVARSA